MTIFLLFLCLIAPEVGYAADVRFVGDRPINAEEIVKLVSTWKRSGSPADSVQSLLVDVGYLDAYVEPDSSSLSVEAGRLLLVESLKINGDSTTELSVREHVDVTSFSEIAEDFLSVFRDSGYYFSALDVSRIQRQERGLSVDMVLTIGPRVRTGANDFIGLTRTDAGSLARFLSIKPGDLLSDDLIERAEREAAAIPFVEFKPPIAIRPREGYTTADLGYQFKEKRPLLFEGGGGYTSGDDSRFVWSLDLTLVNLFGNGRRAQVQSQRPEKGRTVLDVSYSQPLFLIGVGELNAGIATRDYRDQFYEFAVRSGYSFVPGALYRTGIEFGWRSAEPSISSPSFSAYTGSFLLRRETLTNKSNPSEGSVLKGSISYSYRRYAYDSLSVRPEQLIYTETRNKVSLSLFHPLLGRLVGHLGLNYNGLETDESLPPLSELVFVGGPGSLRGFRNERFAALRTAYGSLEPRLRFDSGYLFLFYDGAWLSNRIMSSAMQVVTDEDYRFGYGGGFAISQGGRRIELSIGWNKEVRFDEPRLSLKYSSGI